MTAHADTRPALPYAETGWAQARRRRDRGVRTCLPAVLDGTSRRRPDPDTGGTIVRGED
ncbi:hypothetical protein [Streptomyces lavenduligriseus]|uniref:Uncharacterized protein n=1 Tax=Streptomyces lavenduligriseus TaxID=67315 RepID=A0ABT0NVN1_9ACTN|nr:hypothetical protein [Streptomyces lavenduligriseus]MCL3995523.1 hypothetical protein [Streptomyces lavenduligriseus]